MTLSIGTVSHGTHRTVDLAEAFLPLLEAHGEDQRARDLRDLIRYPDVCDAHEIIAEAMDALNEHCPEYCTFGAHPGDGSDFGCWPDMDAIDDAVQSAEIIKISDLSDLDDKPISEFAYDLALAVNDHGNCTLYSLSVAGTPREIWAIV